MAAAEQVLAVGLPGAGVGGRVPQPGHQRVADLGGAGPQQHLAGVQQGRVHDEDVQVGRPVPVTAGRVPARMRVDVRAGVVEAESAAVAVPVVVVPVLVVVLVVE